MHATASLSPLAADIAAGLGQLEGVDAVHLYGSVARGEASLTSDIDLLVVVGDQDVARTVVARCRAYNGMRVKPNVQSWQRLGSPSLDWSFLYHLAVEGRTIFGDARRVRRALARVQPTDTEIARQIKEHEAFLRRFDDLGMYAGRFFFSAAHLYRVSRSVVILANARAAVYEFDRRRAILRFGQRRRDVSDSVGRICRLEPYYLCADGRLAGGEGLRDPSQNEIRAAVEAVSQVIRVAAE